MKLTDDADGDTLRRLLQDGSDLSRPPRFQALLNRSRQSLEKGEGLPEEEFWGTVRRRAKERKATRGRRTKR